MERTEKCSFCDALLVPSDSTQDPKAIGVPARRSASIALPAEDPASKFIAPSSDAGAYPSVALEPAWREEVTRRLDAYRTRHGRPARNDNQSGLPFTRSATPAAAWDEPENDTEASPESVQYFTHANDRSVPRVSTRVIAKPIQKPVAARKVKNECMEIRIQPEFDFTSRPDDRAHPQNAIVPVATLAERRIAGALDAVFLVLTFGGFLALFASLVGHVDIQKVNAAVYLAAFYLFYAQYFFLFTVFAGATPGMQFRELTIVRLDGTLPDTRQLLWRSFGYLLSGATFMLGYLWSLWDEDRFTWQDRISQTYITAAMPTVDSDAFEVPVTRHTHRPTPQHHHHFAHK